VFAYNPVGVAGLPAAVLIVAGPGAEKLPSISLAKYSGNSMMEG
jgi:hypothetical protein